MTSIDDAVLTPRKVQGPPFENDFVAFSDCDVTERDRTVGNEVVAAIRAQVHEVRLPQSDLPQIRHCLRKSCIQRRESMKDGLWSADVLPMIRLVPRKAVGSRRPSLDEATRISSREAHLSRKRFARKPRAFDAGTQQPVSAGT